MATTESIGRVIGYATSDERKKVISVLSENPNDPEFLKWAEPNLECLDTRISRLARLIIDYSKQSLNGEEN